SLRHARIQHQPRRLGRRHQWRLRQPRHSTLLPNQDQGARFSLAPFNFLTPIERPFVAIRFRNVAAASSTAALSPDARTLRLQLTDFSRVSTIVDNSAISSWWVSDQNPRRTAPTPRRQGRASRLWLQRFLGRCCLMQQSPPVQDACHLLGILDRESDAPKTIAEGCYRYPVTTRPCAILRKPSPKIA